MLVASLVLKCAHGKSYGNYTQLTLDFVGESRNLIINRFPVILAKEVMHVSSICWHLVAPVGLRGVGIHGR